MRQALGWLGKGRSSAIMLLGEAGMGKTHLIEGLRIIHHTAIHSKMGLPEVDERDSKRKDGELGESGSAEAQLVQHRMQLSGQDDADDLDDLSLAWKRAGEVTPRPLADDASRCAALLTPTALCV